MYTFASAPQGIGRILDSGFRLCFSGYRTALQLTGIMALVYAVIIAGFWAAYGGAFFDMLTALNSGTPMTTGIGLYLGFVLATSVPSLVYSNAITSMYGTLGEGKHSSIKQSLAVGTRKFLPVFVYFILYVLIVGVALVPLAVLIIAIHPGLFLMVTFIAIGIIPALIFMISLILGPYIIILDDLDVFAAIKRSHTLIWGQWWRTFVYAFVVYLIFITLPLIIDKLIVFGSGFLIKSNPGSYRIITSLALLINQFASMLFMLFMTALFITYYHDLKLRKEGGDLAARIEAA